MSGFLTPALREFRARVLSTNPQNPAYWLQRMFGGMATSTGRRLGGEDAMTFSAYFAACRNFGQDIGTLSLPIYRHTGDDSRETARNHPAWALLNRQANPEMGAADFRSAIQGQAVGRGNGYAEIEWDSAMRPLAFWPLRSDRMRLVRNGVDVEMAGAPSGQLIYLYTLPNGQEKAFAPANILHIRGFSPNGLVGYSILQLAREGIAIELAAQEYLGRFFANDARPGVALRVPKDTRLSDRAVKNLKESWDSAHRPLEQAHRTAILEDGIEIEKVGMTHEDAEFLATRKFSVTEFSRWTRQPAHMLADLDRSTNNNIEHQGMEYGRYSVRAWLVSWEQELAVKKVTTEPYFAEHNMESFARGDMKARGEFYRTLFGIGSITPEAIMRRENYPTEGLPDSAREPWFPLNMAPASAFDSTGMRMADKYSAVAQLVRVGFEPSEALDAFGLPAIAHSGLVPITVQIDPEKLPQQEATQ